VADEPVSALDVSVQATILNLLRDLRGELGLTLLLISAQPGLGCGTCCDRVAVMYLGRIVEVAPTEQLFRDPRHPYTRGLLAAIPRLTEQAGETGPPAMAGDPPSPLAIPAGCRFRTRCPMAQPRCEQEDPALTAAPGDPGHQAACHFAFTTRPRLFPLPPLPPPRSSDDPAGPDRQRALRGGPGGRDGGAARPGRCLARAWRCTRSRRPSGSWSPNEADHYVGVGGLPNLVGKVELDASIMDGATRRAGAVAAVTGFPHPISIARAVCDLLPQHVMLVGAGAERFADEAGRWRSDAGSRSPRRPHPPAGSRRP